MSQHVYFLAHKFSYKFGKARQLNCSCICEWSKTGAVHEEFYRDCDLTIGGVINVWGRRVIICDCDNFTKEYYGSKYGIGKFKSQHSRRHLKRNLYQ